MKMAAFDYHRPASLDETLDLLARHGADAKVLAGGQSLVPVMAMRLATPAHVIDIGRVAGLDRIEPVDGGLQIGALVRQSAAAASPDVARTVPLLAKALPWIGHRAIRNRGTVCGSIAHADPAAELPAVARALDATMIARSARGTREIPAADFFAGYLSTALADDELLVGVRLPACAPRTGAAVCELARRHGDFALAGTALSIVFDQSGSIDSASCALFGVADTPVRAESAAVVLQGRRPSAALFAEAAAAVSAALNPPDDDHASGAYRRHVAGVIVRRALAQATADAGVDMERAA